MVFIDHEARMIANRLAVLMEPVVRILEAERQLDNMSYPPVADFIRRRKGNDGEYIVYDNLHNDFHRALTQMFDRLAQDDLIEWWFKRALAAQHILFKVQSNEVDVLGTKGWMLSRRDDGSLQRTAVDCEEIPPPPPPRLPPDCMHLQQQIRMPSAQQSCAHC